MVDFLHRRPYTKGQAIEYLQQLPEAHPARGLLTRDGAATLAWAVAESPVFSRTSGRLLFLVYKLGVRPRQNAIEGVVYRLAAARRWSQIPTAVALGRRITGRTTKRLLNWKTRALIECGEWGRVELMLREFQAAQLLPDRRTWHMLVQACLLNSNLPRARDYLVAMERAGVRPDDSTHVAVLAAYHVLGQKDDVEARAFATLRGINPQSDTLVLNSIMQLRMRHGDLSGMCSAFRVFTAPFNIRMSGVEMRLLERPNRKDPIYRPAVDGDYGHVDYAVVKPDAATFAMIIEVFGHQEEIDQVERAYHLMRRCDIRPDGKVVDALIKAYTNVGDREGAWAIFLEVCGSAHMTREFARLFKVASEKPLPRPVLGLSHVRLDVHIYNSFIAALLPSCGIRLFQLCLEHMKAFNVEPDKKTGNILLHYLSNRGQTPRQLIRIATLFARLPPNCRPTIGHVNSILAALLRRRRATHSIVLSKQEAAEHKAQRLEPEADPYDPSAGLANPKNVELAELLSLISERRIRSNSSTFALRLWRDAITKLDLGGARETFRAMAARGIRPNSRHFAILMDGFARTGDMPAAEHVLALALEENNVQPTVVMHTVLIRGYARMRRPDLASRAFFRMASSGIPPDVRAVLALVDAFMAVKKFFFARVLLLRLWKWVIEMPPYLKDANLWVLRRAFSKSEALQTPRPPPSERDRRALRKDVATVLRQWKGFFRPGR